MNPSPGRHGRASGRGVLVSAEVRLATVFSADIEENRVRHLILRIGLIDPDADLSGRLLIMMNDRCSRTRLPGRLRARLRVVLEEAGYTFPEGEIIFESRPGLWGEIEAHLVLPIALALLALDEVIPSHALDDILICGGLAPGGRVMEVEYGHLIRFITSIHNHRRLMLPPLAASRAAAQANAVEVIGVKTLRDAVRKLSTCPVAPPPSGTGGVPARAEDASTGVRP
jgi:hypothetical protein